MKDPFRELVEIIDILRSPEGCPWDREQTFATLRPYLLEETYEILQLIDDNDFARLREELGDLIMHIVFQAQLGKEMGLFDINDVLTAINNKLIHRHPHVFGDVKVNSTEEVLENWEKIKLDEKKKRRLLGGVPRNAPSLLRAFRVQEKAAGVGFEWPDVSGVLDKLHEELGELKEAHAKGDQAKVFEEFGDVLFVLVNVGRYWGIPAEDALRGTVGKFMNRFAYVEDRLAESGRSLHDATLEEMDAYWDEAKAKGIK